MSEKIRVHIFVSGLVQRVFFRANTVETARKLGITGWVKNSPNGQVEAIFEGDKENIQKMIEWAKKGPPNAQVDNIKVDWQEYKGEFNNFETRY